MLNVTIDGIQVQAKEGSTILEAAGRVGIEIPTLCYLKDLTPEASCRICLVEIEGNPKLFTACSTPVAEGNVIYTKSEKVIAARRSVLDLMLSTHNADCFSCGKNGDCQLQNLCYEYGVEKTSYEGVKNNGNVAYMGTHRHDSRKRNETYEYTYMYILEVPVAEGATELLLPNDDKVVVFAATSMN